ncbi:MAG: pyridoxal phosphate-dependent aminotransferase, partial [Methylocystaceae bacterium]|nr:pyridoxal phosphate-dependent aminotransferase [Methylocystaceae bacterium]
MTSSPKLSRRSEVSPFLAMDALREAKELERAGRRIIHMELGEPGAPT